MTQLVKHAILGFSSGLDFMASWVRALHQALHWQCGACLGFPLSPSLSLCLSPTCAVSVSLSKKIVFNYYSIQLSGELLSTFGITWVCESIFSTVNFMKSDYRSTISYEKLVFIWRCAISVKYMVQISKTKSEIKNVK